MKIYSNNLKWAILLIVFATTLIINSCAKEEGVAPIVPPKGAFVMDYNSFNNSKTIGNWAFASVNVGVWNTIITVGLAIPVNSYVAILEQEPQFLSGATWKWEQKFLNIYTAQLFGTVENSKVVWEMKISKEGAFQDFTWYTGYSKLDGSEGEWILYESPQKPTEMLSIGWTYNKADSTGTLTYTNIVPGGAENGGYISYGRTNDNLNAYYDIYNKGKNELTEIEWSINLKNGRVKAPFYFLNSEWHCWDPTLNDTNCPN